MFPRRCNPCPPQLAADSSGVLICEKSGNRELQKASVANRLVRLSAVQSTLWDESSPSDSVWGPETQSPLMLLRQPRSPRPCWTRSMYLLNHRSPNVL